MVECERTISSSITDSRLEVEGKYGLPLVIKGGFGDGGPGVKQADASMAVLAMEMLAPQAAFVLHTASPLDRDEASSTDRAARALPNIPARHHLSHTHIASAACTLSEFRVC